MGDNLLHRNHKVYRQKIFTWEIISAFVIVERQIQQTVSSLTAWLTLAVLKMEVHSIAGPEYVKVFLKSSVFAIGI
jgi:hypothetical protein